MPTSASMPYFNGTHQIIDVPAAGTPISSGLLDILATGPLLRFTIRESLLTAEGAPNTPQGLNYTLNGSARVFQLPAPSVTQDPGEFPEIQVPEKGSMGFHVGYGCPIGHGPDSPGAGQPDIPATVLISISSATTSNTTAVEVWQDYS